MSKVLYIECNMGAAGDMLSAAFYELLSEQQKQEFLHVMNEHCITGVSITPETTEKCGIRGTHMAVKIHGEEETAEDVHIHDHDNHDTQHSHAHDHDNHDTQHSHAHDHDSHDMRHSHAHDHDSYETQHSHVHDHGSHDMQHSHAHDHDSYDIHHHHASLKEIHNMIEACEIPEEVKVHVMEVYDHLAEAESHAHGVPVSEIHFHEVGMMDAVTDVIGVCLLLYMISPDEVVVSPINTGFGQVRCAHGILPVPAPATVYLLKNAPVYAGNIEGELCTPTGAALLQHIKTRFNKIPTMYIDKIGYGMGKKDFSAANCVRAYLGHVQEGISEEEYGKKLGEVPKERTEEQSGEAPKEQSEKMLIDELMDKIVELSCNIDDMTGEELGFASEVLRENGALDVFFTPVQMKKNRPGQVLSCLCKPELEKHLVGLILKHTSTWGVRRRALDRYVLERHTEECQTSYGKIRVRCGSGYGVRKCKAEYEDVAVAAKNNGVTVRDVLLELGDMESDI